MRQDKTRQEDTKTRRRIAIHGTKCSIVTGHSEGEGRSCDEDASTEGPLKYHGDGDKATRQCSRFTTADEQCNF